MHKGGSVYILTNAHNTILYVGVTSNLAVRIAEHKSGKYSDSFTAKYNCNKLVHFENFLTVEEAIAREKQFKNWKREWKLNKIKESNPEFKDLFEML